MTTILIVEDNEMNRDILSRQLIRKGFEVGIALNGKEGVDFALANAPDLILMDMDLPVMDGWEATRLLKSQPETAGIPVVAVTAHAMSGDREKAVRAGCDDFIPKPVDFGVLLVKINNLLSNHKEL